jgi:hypothetical protein
MSRTCLFCDRAPVTLEHVWPEWTAAVWTEAPSYTHDYKRGDEPVRSWPALGPDVTANVVDDHCNSGWMSTLEATAKPLLMPMAAGELVWLGASEQANLSLWALKTALMFKSLEIGSRSFNLGFYKTLYSHLPEPPPRGAYVWLGRFDLSVTSGPRARAE